MNSYNVCSFIGNVPKHEAFKPTFVEGTENRRARYSATLAVRRDRKKEGEQYYAEDLIRFTAWGPTAEFLNKYAPQGTTIAIVGSLNVDTIDKDGDKRTYYNIVVDGARIVGSNGARNDNQDSQEAPQPTSSAPITNPFRKNNAANATSTPAEQPAAQESEVPRFNPFGKGKG